MFPRGTCIAPNILSRWDAKKNSAIYHIMWLVDAGESVAQKEGQGRPSKLTKAREKKVTYCNHGKMGPLCNHSLFCVIELIRR